MGHMRTPATPIPSRLGPSFTRGEAIRAGATDRRLRAPDLERVCHGVYRRRFPRQGQVSSPSAQNLLQRHPPLEVSDPYSASRRPAPLTWTQGSTHERWRARQRDLACALGKHLPPHCFFTGATAAVLWGLPTFGEKNSALEVASFLPKRALRRKGVAGSGMSPRIGRIAIVQGVRVADVATTWLVYGSRQRLENAVALGDAAIRLDRIPGTDRLNRPPLTSSAELESAIKRGKRPGIARLRAALPLLSGRSASVPETLLRLLLASWGRAAPALDFDVRGTHGKLLGCSEFAYPGHRLAVEYEGEYHLRSPAQWNRDIEKYRDYNQHGWEVLRVTKSLLFQRPSKLRAQLEEALVRCAPP